MKKGKLVNTNFFGIYIEKAEVEFNIVENTLEICFLDFCIEECNTNSKSPQIYIFDDYNNAITLKECYFKTKSNKKSTIICIAVIYGDHIKDLENMVPKSISFVVGSDPVPLIGLHMPLNNFNFDIHNVLLKIEWYSNSLIKLELISNEKNMSVSDLEYILFRVIEILFLCFGFFPYIDKVIINYNENKSFDVYYNQHNEYKKGQSNSHWLPIITDKDKIDLQKAYTIYTSMFKKIQNVIKVMTNASHTNTIVINLILSLLIQCVEGYMRAIHSSKKYPKRLKCSIIKTIMDSLNDFDFAPLMQYNINRLQIENSITGLLGKINDNSLADCIHNAFNLNEYTEMIVKKEKNDGRYLEFISKSKATRNQFSHMSLQDKAFEDVYEIIMAKDKYILLLRALLLSDLQIPINPQLLSRWIDSIEESWQTNVENEEI